MKTTPKSNITTFLKNPFSQTNIPNQNTKFRTAPKAQKQKQRKNSSATDRSFRNNSSATKNLEQLQKLTTKISKIQEKKHILTMKPRYFKMDDVLYPLRILHRYLHDTSRYVSREYPKIKFYFFKKIIIRYFPILIRRIFDNYPAPIFSN